MKSAVLVDGNSLMHRAYHGVNRGFIPTFGDEKMPIGMVFGFCSSVLNAIDFFRPSFFLVTFDSREKTFRHQIAPDYKAQRKAAPDDFYPQIPFLFEFLEAAGITFFKKPGFESDDLIGTLAKKADSEGVLTTILSGDLDFLQLVNERVKLAKFNGNLSQSIVFGEAETHARTGVFPRQIVDFKAICGDSSDNYKGVAGLGPKTAAKLLTEWETLEKILENVEKLPPKIAEKFQIFADSAKKCQTLAQIKTDVDLDFSFSESQNELLVQKENLQKFFEKMNFRVLARRLENLGQSESNLVEKSNAKKQKTEDQMSLF